MQETKPAHYWRIHRRVCRRIFFDLPFYVRDVIAADHLHETQDYKWFEKKVAEDTQRLFDDPTYYDNDSLSFRIHSSKF
jgi:hypothetical protein